MCAYVLVIAMLAAMVSPAYAQSSQKNQTLAIEKCIEQKVALFRKHEGEGPLIRFDMLEEWRRDCAALSEKQKTTSSTSAVGSWKIGSSGQLQQFRSHALTKADNGFLTLAIQFAPPACEYDWNVLFKLPEQNTSTSVLVWTQKIQIDNGRIWQSRVRYPQRLGDEVAVFTQEPVTEYHEILQSMPTETALWAGLIAFCSLGM